MVLVMMPLREFNERFAILERGERIEYYNGNLAHDRKWMSTHAADEAWKEYKAGRALLFQRRVSPGVVTYICQRR